MPMQTALETYLSWKWATACSCKAPRVSRISLWPVRHRPSPRVWTWMSLMVQRAPTGTQAANTQHLRRERNITPCHFWTVQTGRGKRKRSTDSKKGIMLLPFKLLSPDGAVRFQTILKILGTKLLDSKKTMTVAFHSALTWALRSWKTFYRWWTSSTTCPDCD